MSPADADIGRPERNTSSGSETGTGSDTVTVAIVTYRRPADLQLALTAVLADIELYERTRPAGKSPVGPVLVVDNDAAASGQQTALAFGGAVRYFCEPTPGIAAARNRALAESAQSRYVIFIDDDEHPEPGWLSAMVATAQRTGAAAVAGPVISVFDVAPDPWVAAGRFFDRRRLPTGTPITLAATNNLLLDRTQLDSLTFDEAFGLTGGSDTLFTRTLHAAGRRMIWCDEAVVLDRVPADRVTRSWVLRRAFRMSNTGVRVGVTLARNSGGSTARARLDGLVRGMARIAGGTARVALGTARRSAADQAKGRRTAVRGAGMVCAAAGFVYSEYARDEPSSRWRRFLYNRWGIRS